MHPRSPLSVVLILSLTVELQIALSASAIAEQKMSGLIAEELTPESAADKAGLKLGDTIISYDGKPLASPAVFNAAQENTFAKKEVTLEVRRGEELLEIRVPMGVIGIRVRPALSPAVEDLYEQGKSGLKSKAADKVSAKWKAAAELAQQEGDEKAAAWLYGRIGETQEHQQRCTEAREAFSMAWKLFKDSSDAAARAIIARGLGRCSGRSGDLVAAQSWFEQAQRLDLDAGNEFWLARDLNGLGIVAYERGDLDASYGYHTRALSIRERLAPDSRDVADSLDNLGNIEIDRGGLRAAQGFYLRALSVYEHLSPDSLDLAGTLDNLGNVASDRGDLRAAEEYHTRALSIRERLAPDSQDVAESLNNLGNVSIGRGDLKAAWYFYDRALSLHERLAPDSLEVAGSLGNMGVVARDRGDLQTANDYLTRALKIEERLAPNSIDVAASFSDLGSLASSRGDLQAAQQFYNRALSIYGKLAPGSMDLARSLSGSGQVARSLGDLRAAQKDLMHALEIEGRLAPDSVDVATSLSELGAVSALLNDQQRSTDFYVRSSSILDRLAPNSLMFADTLIGLGNQAIRERRLQDADQFFKRAIAIVESQRSAIASTEDRALLLAQNREPYIGELRTQLALNDPADAFQTSERAHARSLLELLTEAHTQIRKGVEPALLKSEEALQQSLNAKARYQTRLLSGNHADEEIAAVSREIDELTLEYHDVETKIRSTSPHYAALTQPQPLSLKEVQQQVLEKDTLLLEYVLGDEASYLFTVTPISAKAYMLPKRAELESLAGKTYDALTARNRHGAGETLSQRDERIQKADAEYIRLAARLSKLILGPAASELDAKRLLIVGDGILLQIPFGALPEPSPNGSRALILSHEIVNLPSASVIAAQRREIAARKPAALQVAIFGDPVFDRYDERVKTISGAPTESAESESGAYSAHELERAIKESGIGTDRGTMMRLLFSRREAQAIFSLASPGAALEALGFDASKELAISSKLGNYKIIHFATHAMLNEDHPELSGIVLSLIDSQGRDVDGFLRLNDVYNMNLPADMVVLSACQTGLGKQIKSEGSVGLVRGFMYAGAARVVASQWKVDDSATAELMTRFYEKMLRGGEPVSAALRHAQIEMIQQERWRNPYFWAAFEMQGEWRQ